MINVTRTKTIQAYVILLTTLWILEARYSTIEPIVLRYYSVFSIVFPIIDYDNLSVQLGNT